MASVDYAWSIELGQELTASEAHEKWFMGILSDKTMFECRDENCHAQITCINMDKQQYQMKMREHFKVYGQHSEKCEEVKRNKDVNRKYKTGAGTESPELEEEITFSMERLPSHKETQIDKHNDDFSEGQSVENKVVKKEKEGVKRSGSRKSHLYLVHTLVTKYLYGLKNGTLAKIKVNICYPGSKKIYPTPLDKLFKNIKSTPFVSEEAWKTKIFFGKANISKNKKGEYWVNFEEPLYNDERKVCCVINQQIIDNTLSKNASKKLLEGFIYKENIYCFTFGKLKETKDRIYINILTLDHLACTTEDIERLDDLC